MFVVDGVGFGSQDISRPVSRRTLLRAAGLAALAAGTATLAQAASGLMTAGPAMADGGYAPPLIFARGDPAQPYVYLTFDDGYNAQAAVDIAAAADALGVLVTFLPVTNVVQTNPGLWRDIAARGHGICNHTMSHPYLTSLSYSQKVREILNAKEILERVLQLPYPVTIMRPPFGKYDADVTAICRANGIRIVTGTVDSLGYTQGQDGSQRATTVAINSAKRGLITGGIVVMHCIPSDRNAAPTVLQAALDAGLQPASLPAQIAG